MPVYEYECLNCGEHLDELQKFSDAPLETHDGCGGRLRRVLSAPAIQFKGSGWYVTDYGRRSGGPSDDGRKDEAKAKGKTGSGNGASGKKSAKESSSTPANKETK